MFHSGLGGADRGLKRSGSLVAGQLIRFRNLLGDEGIQSFGFLDFELAVTNLDLPSAKSANASFGETFQRTKTFCRSDGPKTINMAPSETQPIDFLFINTAHPSEASTSKSLSRIRSHAAKEMRARAAKTHERTKYRARRSQQAISDPTGTSRCRAQRGEDGEKRPTALLPQRVLAQPLSVKEPHWNLVRALSAHETSLLDHCMRPCPALT